MEAVGRQKYGALWTMDKGQRLCFIGLLLRMTELQQPTREDYWKVCGLLEVDLRFNDIMTQREFNHIYMVLQPRQHKGTVGAYPFAPVRRWVESCVQRWQCAFSTWDVLEANQLW